jgi:hypothetical protein
MLRTQAIKCSLHPGMLELTHKAGKNYSQKVELERKAIWHTKCMWQVALRGLCPILTTKWIARLQSVHLCSKITLHSEFSSPQWFFLKAIGKAVNEAKRTTPVYCQRSPSQCTCTDSSHKDLTNKWGLFNRTTEQIRLFKNISRLSDHTATTKTRSVVHGNSI